MKRSREEIGEKKNRAPNLEKGQKSELGQVKESSKKFACFC